MPQFPRPVVESMNLQRYVVWLHDYGSQFGFRLALSALERVAGLIIQNRDIYADAFGPKCDFLKKIWGEPRSRRAAAHRPARHPRRVRE